jgi:hypothetical protein
MAVKDKDDLEKAIQEVRKHLEEAQAGLARTVEQTEESLRRAREALQPWVEAFAQTVRRLIGDAELSPEAARRAALLAVSEAVWGEHIGPTMSSADVAELLGGVTRQRVSELAREHRLIALRERSGRTQFPAMQFRDGEPLQPLVRAFWIVADAPVDPWTAASWSVSPHDGLEDLSPAQWARGDHDPDQLLRVAHRDAARLSQ